MDCWWLPPLLLLCFGFLAESGDGKGEDDDVDLGVFNSISFVTSGVNITPFLCCGLAYAS